MAIFNKSAGGGEGEAPPLTMDSILGEVDKRIGVNISAHFDKFRKEGLGAAIDERLAPINTSLTGISESLAKLTPVAPPVPVGGGGDGSRSQVPPEVNASLKSLQETVSKQGLTITTLQKQKEESDQRAEKAERHGTIRSALNSLNFVNDSAANTAFTIVEPHIRRMDDGQLVGGIGVDNFPVDTFVKDYLTKDHGYLMRTSGASGSGAPVGGGAPRFGTKVDTADIKVGMKPETRQAAVESIAAALQQA